MSLGVAHQLFLQGLMSRGAAPEPEARDMCRRAAQAAGERYDADLFPGFVSTLNRRLKPLGMEVGVARMEDGPTHWYGLVNRNQDAAAKAGTSYSPAELQLFNKVVEFLVLSDDGTVPSTEVLNATTALDRKISYRDAQTFLKQLLTDKWLAEAGKGVYCPGPRFILELRPFLKESFGEEVPDCHICKDPVIRGHCCGADQCGTKLHLYCVTKLAAGRGSFRCPSCQSTWSHDIPNIDLSEEEPGGSVAGGKGPPKADSVAGGVGPSQPRKKSSRRQ